MERRDDSSDDLRLALAWEREAVGQNVETALAYLAVAARLRKKAAGRLGQEPEIMRPAVSHTARGVSVRKGVVE